MLCKIYFGDEETGMNVGRLTVMSQDGGYVWLYLSRNWDTDRWEVYRYSDVIASEVEAIVDGVSCAHRVLREHKHIKTVINRYDREDYSDREVGQ